MNIKIEKRVLANVIIAGAFAVHGIRTIVQPKPPVKIFSAESVRPFHVDTPDSSLVNLRRISITV